MIGNALKSLDTRVVLYTLTVLLVGMWSLSFYANETLREDMGKLLGEQQLAKATIMADTVEQELSKRQRALELLARHITPAMLASRTATQTFLAERLMLHDLFGSGVVVLDAVGEPESDCVGGPHIHWQSGTAVFDLAVPIHDERKATLGWLVGRVDLSKHNFLDRVGEFGEDMRGSFFLVDPQQRRIIAATDKSRVLEHIPGPSRSSTLLDRFIAGYVGTLVDLNTRGVEVMSSAKAVPSTGWLVIATLPASEAFAPVARMQQRMRNATYWLTLFAALLTWWLLRRQLKPIRTAIRALSRHARSDEVFQALPVSSEDEIGALIGAFNRVLAQLKRREEAQRESEARLQALANDLERLVRERTDQLRSISAQLTMAEERERRLLAQELHDDLGQYLAAAKIRLGALETKSKTQQERIGSIVKLIDDAHRSVRQITQEWSPPLLNVLGFLPAVEWLVEDIRRLYSITVISNIDLCRVPLREETQTFVFRSLRELLINAAKHAGVTSAEVFAHCHEGNMQFTVHDAGCGFDPAPVLQSTPGRLSYGLRSITERIQTLGGRLQIDSQIGKGTTVTLAMPCDKLAEECTEL